eukprot:TRINITY_DN1930_c0_g1_i3.p1 TRINITY_DN1930_c0_g1~~TRINITY_DN1930_c0_g1_i3.p1  ORF type:complete len:190 (-),score=49.15 TRINITY_DN1930_c0_g1_i3:52-588(-)
MARSVIALLVLSVLLALICQTSAVATKKKTGGYLDMWSKWGDKAYQICKDHTKRESKCDMFQEVVEDVFQDIISKMASATEKSIEEVTAVSLKKPFRGEGERIIKQAIRDMLSQKIKTEEALRQHFMKTFSQWLMNVAVNNPQSMMQSQFQGMSVEEIQAAVKGGALRNDDNEEDDEE